MKKLFLSAYFSGVAKLFQSFTENTCSGKTVVFIPTASIVEKVNFYVASDKKALIKLGMTIDELEISKATPEEIKTKITNADYIFVEGGNTFYLLQELKRTGTDKLIVEQINNGKLYIGVSAGSMIISKDIEFAKLMDDPAAAPDLKDYSALGLIDFCVVPHYNNVPFKKAVEKIIAEYSGKLDLHPISNNQVVTVNGDTIETLSVEKKKK
ncbi:MAG: Type 1 glutamine amidotransferase-like domain-containing protein [Spirochaetaceae bacterium]|jgi:dipeptidase E|nr:Type 1 glutamine amidotransferase-like domain-containing protein [Spirochaetaceae bacterium]